MGIFDRFKKQPPPKARRTPSLRRKKSYEAAMADRLASDWTTINRAATAELRSALRPLRARSRELARNNDYARKFLKMVGANVVGEAGIKLQVRSRNGAAEAFNLDKFANDQIERHWKEWGKRGVCTVDGKLSWIDAQNLFITSVARDGELMVRKIFGPSAGNEFGFALQFLEADYLDEDNNGVLPNGNRVEMSVEFDKWKRPVAYHLLDEHPGAEFHSTNGRRYTRVEADKILHPFIMERADQARGVPWMVSAMLRLQMLGKYEEAEIVAARIAASKMAFFTSPDAEGYTGDGEDGDGNLTMEVEPGVLEQLPKGVGFEAFDPKHPNTGFDEFSKSILRGISSGIGVSYNGLANDLTGVNYSSIRQGSLDERDLWRTVQRWTVESFCDPIFSEWLWGFLGSELSTLPASKHAKFNTPVWSPRGWQWVDPMKEVQANIKAVEAGFKSRTDVLAEQGRDFEETLDQLAAEKELTEAAGITLQSEVSDNDQANTEQPENDNGNNQDAKTNTNGDD